MRLVKVTDYERQRRATNVIAIGPRKVVGYAGNVESSENSLRTELTSSRSRKQN